MKQWREERDRERESEREEELLLACWFDGGVGVPLYILHKRRKARELIVGFLLHGKLKNYIK